MAERTATDLCVPWCSSSVAAPGLVAAFHPHHAHCHSDEKKQRYQCVIVWFLKPTKTEIPVLQCLSLLLYHNRRKLPWFTDVPLVVFMYLVFTWMPGKSYHRRLRSLLLWLCNLFQMLLHSLVYGLILYHKAVPVRTLQQQQWAFLPSTDCSWSVIHLILQTSSLKWLVTMPTQQKAAAANQVLSSEVAVQQIITAINITDETMWVIVCGSGQVV